MSEDRVSKTLQEMGFSDIETRIYLFLSKRGQQKGRDLALALKINKQQLYPSLKNLQNKGIVSQTLEHPARFNALPFDRIIDLYLKAKMEEVRRIEQSKDQILSDWQSIVVNAAEGQSDRFMVFEGRTRIFSTLEKMIQESKKNLQAIASVNGVRQVDAAGLFEKAQIHMSKSHIKFSLLLDLTSNDEKLIQKLLKGISKGQKNLQVRSPILPLKAFPTLLMKDNEEILLFIKPLGENSRNEKADVCLWTNCRTIITAFDTIFQDLWHTSTQTKSGLSLEDQQSKVTYQSTEDLAEKIEKAKNEIFILTSSEGLVNLQISPNTLAVLKEKGIQIKILATIDQKNFETAKLLSQYSTIKHIPENTLDVIVVDKTHLFQSRHNLSKDKVGSHLVYSQSIQYIERMKETLDEMWKSAQKPSEVTLESISGPYGYSVFPTPNQAQKAKIESTTNYQFKVLNIKPAALTTEKDILNKILHGKKHAITKANKVNVMYASAASAVIHPPSNFNLPKMLINVNHIEKKSSLGEADVIEVHLCLDDSNSHPCFTPMGGLGDNPQGVLHRRNVYAGTPFEKNYQLVNKDQLEVRVYGNTLFAGWTVPIKLDPLKHVLPPGCIIFEGYGNVKSSSVTLINPLGIRVDREQNWFDAFVTFMHPASKYSGPGTDGLFTRDLIVTTTPP